LPGYGYKEFTVPPTDRGEFAFFPNALHIWPRGEFMLIALPNLDKSFTCTLFLPEAGAISFRSLSQPGEFRKFFISQFPDLSIYCLEFEKAFQENPVGTLQTVRCSPWNASDQVLLLGDAAHAILPFFGQGMNCGFEDCSVFNCALDETSDRKALFDWISSERKPQADAIADMAIENFVEMRDKVGDPDFLMKRSIEKVLLEKFPDQYVSRYSLVTFSTRSYQEAFQVGQRNELILEELSEALKDLSELDLAKAQRLITAAESRSI